MTKEDILDALRGVKYPPYSRDIVSFGMVKYAKAGDGRGSGTSKREELTTGHLILEHVAPSKDYLLALGGTHSRLVRLRP